MRIMTWRREERNQKEKASQALKDVLRSYRKKDSSVLERLKRKRGRKRSIDSSEERSMLTGNDRKRLRELEAAGE
jgi:hypothetical protein